MGNPFPWLACGLNIGAEWRGVDLQLFFQGVAGNELYNAQRHQLEGPGNEAVMSTAMRNAWTPSTRDGAIPSPRNSVNFATSSRFIEPGDYLRLKNLQIGYTVPQALSKKASVKLKSMLLILPPRWYGIAPIRLVNTQVRNTRRNPSPELKRRDFLRSKRRAGAAAARAIAAGRAKAGIMPVSSVTTARINEGSINRAMTPRRKIRVHRNTSFLGITDG